MSIWKIFLDLDVSVHADWLQGPHQGVGGAKDETNPQVFVQMLAILSPETVIPDIFDKVSIWQLKTFHR